MAFIFCQPDIYRNEMYQDKIFIQGVRPIGADNKIFLSEQAPTEYFIIHSCMSHSNSKIVAISTVKHLSRNYASFQQPSVQEWYSLSTSGQTQSSSIKEYRWLSWRWIIPTERRTHKRLTNRFCKCRDVNSQYRRIQVISVVSEISITTLYIIQNALFTIPHENHTASHTLNTTEITHFFISA